MNKKSKQTGPSLSLHWGLTDCIIVIIVSLFYCREVFTSGIKEVGKNFVTLKLRFTKSIPVVGQADGQRFLLAG